MNLRNDAEDQNASEPGAPRPQVLPSAIEQEIQPDGATIAPPTSQAFIVDPEVRPCGTDGMAWLLSWLATLGAGGFYGMLIGGNEPIFSFFAGIIIAGIVGVPVIVSVEILAWTLWLSRFQFVRPTLAGACTGIASSALIAPQIYPDAAIPLIVVAGCLGGGGAAFATFAYWSERSKPLGSAGNDTSRAWQYSLRDLFLRFTVLTILIAAWAALLVKVTG